MAKMNLKTIRFSLLLICALTSPVHGLKDVSVDQNKPVLYYAESQTYDRELGILILKGHVEFNHEGTILEADYVTYNESADIVTASGNVRMRQPNGDTNFAEYVELTGDMKEGIVLQLRSLLEDDSKLAALEGRKFEDRQELEQAVYTPCVLCGDKPPTWQLNARRALKDDVNKDIHFTDTHLRILDVPVMYFPYATQPLERRSGFLIPQPNYSTDLGFIAEVPYYFAL
jgi:LPS-assembly protein